MAHSSEHFAAVSLDDIRGVSFQCLTKSIVSGEEKPGIAALANNCAARGIGQCVSVINVMHGAGRTGFIGQACRTRSTEDRDAVLFACDLGNCKRRSRRGDVEDGINLFAVKPFARLAGCNVRLVLVVGIDQFNRLTRHLATKVLNRHLCCVDATHARNVGVEAGHVENQADLYNIVRDAGMLSFNGTRHGDQSDGDHGFKFHVFSFL